MKESVAIAAGLVGMGFLGYWTAFHAQDYVWLLVPGVGLVLAVVAVTKLFLNSDKP